MRIKYRQIYCRPCELFLLAGTGRLLLGALCSLGGPMAVATVIMGPLDRLRILQQTEDAIKNQTFQQRRGTKRRLGSLWVGAGCGGLRLTASSMYAVHCCMAAIVQICSLALSSFVASAVCHPIELIRTVLIAGLLGFYSGFSFTCLSVIPFSFLAASFYSPCLSALISFSHRWEPSRGSLGSPQKTSGGTDVQHRTLHDASAEAASVGASDSESSSTSLGALPGVLSAVVPVHTTGGSTPLLFTLSLLSAYLSSRAAQGIIYPIETLR
ncbi:uncharacterized protein LOC113146670 [Cyclospora cayetanensis]|uniref:Uncharacterized protein LOC113146670 n=1 Tax=Cyclospora cayetanensis TaxID=88456 RepID=A0A6P6RRT7_9EIME|nr:uncharacterized protein LOC113146670 [Cyclospora cayetanensis]